MDFKVFINGFELLPDLPKRMFLCIDILHSVIQTTKSVLTGLHAEKMNHCAWQLTKTDSPHREYEWAENQTRPLQVRSLGTWGDCLCCIRRRGLCVNAFHLPQQRNLQRQRFKLTPINQPKNKKRKATLQSKQLLRNSDHFATTPSCSLLTMNLSSRHRVIKPFLLYSRLTIKYYDRIL